MIGGEIGRPVPVLHRSGHADADAPDPPGQAARRREQLAEQLLDPIERDVRSVRDAGRLVVVAEDPAVERGDGDVDRGRAEVGDQHVAGVGAERELARRPAAGARARVALDDEPAIQQLRDALGDDAAAEAGARDEVAARLRVAQPDLVEDGDERVQRLLGDGPGDGVAGWDRAAAHGRIIRASRRPVEGLSRLTRRSTMTT